MTAPPNTAPKRKRRKRVKDPRKVTASEFWATQLKEVLEELANLGENAGQTARWKLREEARRLRVEMDKALDKEEEARGEEPGEGAELDDESLVEELALAISQLPFRLQESLRHQLIELNTDHVLPDVSEASEAESQVNIA